MKSGLWPHQSAALDFIRDRSGSMLPLKMGRGKSRVVVEYLLEKRFNRTLITCPKSVIQVWPKEFQKYSNDEFRVLALTEGSVSDKALLARSAFVNKAKPVVLIINYEACREPAFLKFLNSTLFDLIVLDESHRCASPGSKTTRIFRQLAKRTPYRLALTGTPFADNPLDIYGQYLFVDRSVFGTSFNDFRSRYAVLDPSAPYPKILKYQNQLELQEKFYSAAFDPHKFKDIELPNAEDSVRYCELSPSARKVYKEVEKDFYSQVEAGEISVKNALTKLLRLQQITGGYLKLDEGVYEKIDDSKPQLLQEVLEEIAPEEPIVIFARFRADLDEILKACRKVERLTSELSGRENTLKQWQDEGSNVLVCQISAGSVGIDLTRAAYCIYYSTGFGLAEWEQSRARTLRPGQTRNVVYINLISKGTVDVKVHYALEHKQDVVESILSMKNGEIQQ